MDRHMVRIQYKSGIVVDVKCTSFTVKFRDGEISSIEWTNLSPVPLYIGVDNIEAVWEV